MTTRQLPTIPLPDANVAGGGGPNVALAVDTSGSRILIYPNMGGTPGTPAAVLGQPDLQATGCNNGGLDAGSLCSPAGAFVDFHGNLWIADTGNNRVLQYAYPWFSWNPTTKTFDVATAASRVFGQPTFTGTACAAGASGLCAPQGVTVDLRDNIYIADTANNRVVHHENPLADADAERVYGQASFAGVACNAGGAVSTTSLCDPRGVVVSAAGDLYIADRGNNRVVRYADVYSAGGDADGVFGQPDGTTTVCGAGASGLCGPTGLAFDLEGNLLIADTQNSRVLVFETPAQDVVADRVLGQPDFQATGCGPTTAESLCRPIGIVADRAGSILLVADAGNQRIVRYDAPYCLQDFVIGPTNPKQRDVSQPQATRLKISVGTVPPGNVLAFADKLVLLENDGSVDGFDTPVLTLSTDAGVVYREKVPSVSNLRSTDTGGTYATQWLKGERDQGIDDYKLTTRFVFPGDPAKPQYDRLRYKGRAVGLDLSVFTASRATWRAHFSRGSLCFTSELECRGTGAVRSCRVAR
jgi:sugar lactone lactonase YvrE